MRITLSMTLEQACAVRDALDLYARLGTGQFEEFPNLLRRGVIPIGRHADEERKTAEWHQVENIEKLLKATKTTLCYPSNGHNGIGHAHTHLTVRRAYETMKALAKPIAENTNPDRHTVDHEGLTVRYTQDPAPVAIAKNATSTPMTIVKTFPVADNGERL